MAQVNLIKFCAVQNSNLQPPDYQAIFLPIRPWHNSHGLRNHFMVYIQMAMTAEKATKLGHDQVTRLEAHRFVLSSCWWHSTVFQLKFLHKRWQWLQSIQQDWGEWNPSYAIIWQITHPELHKVWLSGIISLNWHVRMVAFRQWGDSRVWEQITLPINTLEIKIPCATTLELVS